MQNYFSGVGRRKTAVARVRLTPSSTPTFTVNGKPLTEYFRTMQLQEIVMAPLKITGKNESFSCSVKVNGGGFHGQAEAVRHGISRSLLDFEAGLRPTLKPYGFLTRDPRMKERKKPGLHRARRAPQWAKR
ncbi:MAG: 30S ribosomal protein S9 [Patescibacteria group bacterium]|nr:30S ribosomal protein S9 [Patescibacteria group bacterium]